MSERKWYVLCVEPGKEQKIRRELLKQAKIADLHPTLYKSAIVPTTRSPEPRAKDGKLVMVTRIKYDGYIFLNMVYCVETAELVQKIKDQFGLLPHRGQKPKLPPNRQPSDNELAEFERWVNWTPTGLASSEAAALLLEERRTAAKKLPPKKKFQTGDVVKVVDKKSPWFDTSGSVVLTDTEDQVMFVTKVLGKEVTVDLAVWQIEKN